MKYIIEIPSLPPVECSKNWRGHWAPKARAVQVARAKAFYFTLEKHGEELSSPGWKPISHDDIIGIHYIWHVQAKRRRDRDNFIGRSAPFLDGLKPSTGTEIGCGLIVDDEDIPISGEFVVDGTSATTIIVEVRNA